MDSGDDLPNCNSDTLGRLYYVASTTTFEVCLTSGWSFIDIKGADGQDGKDGTNGKDGADGSDGKDGADGADGKDGTTDVGGISVVGGQVEALETVDENGGSTWSAVVTVIGGGFDKGSVTIDSSASGVSGSATANSDGAFSKTFTMEVTPDDLDVPITVTASAGSKLASTGFVVVNNEDNWVRAE